jgi:hypothetical protein
MAEPKYPEVKDWMNDLMAMFECDDVRDLAAVLGYPEGDPERKVYRWHAGQNRPSYQHLMNIFKKLAERDQPRPMPKAVTAPAVTPVHLAEVRELVERQGKATTSAIRSLAAAIRKLERKLEPPAQEANGA